MKLFLDNRRRIYSPLINREHPFLSNASLVFSSDAMFTYTRQNYDGAYLVPSSIYPKQPAWTTAGNADSLYAPNIYTPFSLSGNEALTIWVYFIPTNTTEANRALAYVNTNVGDTAVNGSIQCGLGQNGADVTLYHRRAVQVSAANYIVPGRPISATYHSTSGPYGNLTVNGTYIGRYLNDRDAGNYFRIGGGHAGGSTAQILFAVVKREQLSSTTASEYWNRELLRDPFQLFMFRKRMATVPQAATPFPTLSNARMTSLTSTQGVPNVDYAF